MKFFRFCLLVTVKGLTTQSVPFAVKAALGQGVLLSSSDPDSPRLAETASIVTSPKTHCEWHLGGGAGVPKKKIRPQGDSLARKASQFFKCIYQAVP